MNNPWNLLHAIVPFSVLFYVLRWLEKMPRQTSGTSTYIPGVFIILSLSMIAISLTGLFITPKGLKNFIALLVVHPFWIFSAITPYVSQNALDAAITSFIIMVVSCIVQIIVGVNLEERAYKD